MITFTGIDAFTDLEEAQKFFRSTNTEAGVLWSESEEGRNRYPSWERIVKVLSLDCRVAVHICGKKARDVAYQNPIVQETLRRASRIQVNGSLTTEHLSWFLATFDKQTIITQDTQHNALLRMVWGDGRHALLVDGSGGRGVLPSEWKAPTTSKPVGFAGGLGPKTLATEMEKIKPLMRRGAWVDMESSLRDEQDRFSLEAAKECFRIISDSWNEGLTQ